MIRSFLLLTQLSIGVMTPAFLCIFIGYVLDERWGTHTMIWFLILGFLAGGRNGWLLVKREMKMQEDKEE